MDVWPLRPTPIPNSAKDSNVFPPALSSSKLPKLKRLSLSWYQCWGLLHTLSTWYWAPAACQSPRWLPGCRKKGFLPLWDSHSHRLVLDRVDEWEKSWNPQAWGAMSDRLIMRSNFGNATHLGGGGPYLCGKVPVCSILNTKRWLLRLSVC